MHIYLFFLLLLLASCSGQKPAPEEKTFEVAVLRGPSAIAFAQWIKESPRLEDKKLCVNVIDSPEQMQALLIKGSPDIAVLPMATAANLYNKGISYKLLGCPIWGTLYLVGHDSISSPVYLFGAGTTPDILTRRYLKDQGDFEYNYTFSTPREMLLALQTGKVGTAVLSEPFLSMALRKDSSLCILADLNRPDNRQSAFAQTAIVCKDEMLPWQNQLDSLLKKSCAYANEETDETIRVLEEKEVFAPKMLTQAAIHRCRITFVPASRIRKEIKQYLELIQEYEPRALGGKLPDAGFIPDEP